MHVFFALFTLTLSFLAPWTPHRAKACSPLRYVYIKARTILPVQGTTGLPTNVQIQIHYNVYGQKHFASAAQSLLAVMKSFTLRATGSQQDIPIHTKTWSGFTDDSDSFVVLLKPAHSLQANTRYHLLSPLTNLPCYSTAPNIPGASLCQAGPLQEISTFTTGQMEDNIAPNFGGLTSIHTDFTQLQPICPFYETSIEFTWSWKPAQDNGPNSLIRYNLYKLPDLQTPIAPPLQQTQYVGQYLCHVPGTLAFGWTVYTGQPGKFIVRAVDIAGNEDQNSKTHSLPDLCRALAERKPESLSEEPFAEKPASPEPFPDGTTRPVATGCGGCNTTDFPDDGLFWLFIMMGILLVRGRERL